MLSLSLTKSSSDFSLTEYSFAVYCECIGTRPLSIHWFDNTVNDDKEIMVFRDIKLVPVSTKNITANVYCKVHNEYGSHHKNLSLGMDGSVDKSILSLSLSY